MVNISAQAVRTLREKTDLPMMECKQALSECEGNFEAAIEWLRKKYKGKLADRADRSTSEGRIGVYIDPSGKFGAIIELQCETAPVAHNEMFIDLANAFAKKTALGKENSPAPETLRADAELDKMYTDVFGRLREAMNLTRCRKVEGAYLSSYVHHDGKSGVMLALNAAPKSDKKIGPDLCMHSLFTNPLAVDRSGVPSESVEKIRKEAREIATSEGKPASIVEKIADGKVNSFYAERVLVEQLHVKADDYGKTKIADVLKQAGVDAVTSLVIMKVGV